MGSDNCACRSLRLYAEKCFQRSGQTKWPSVRMAAKALRITQSDLQDLVDGCGCGGSLMLTGYNIEGHRLGDMDVEVLNPIQQSL